VVGASIGALAAGTYITQVTITASDANGVTVQGSAQSFAVSLTVLPPCVLSPPAPATLAFSLPQGQSASTTQEVIVKETGTCARPVSWKASASDAWLVLLKTAGNNNGTFGVNVTAASLVPGTYSGTITITATDSSGATVIGSGQMISISFTVTTTLSGSVVACPGSTPPTCTTSQPLPGATVTLMSGSTTVATTTADASGNYLFSGIASGTYNISVAGYDASNNPYIGSLTLTLTVNTSNVTIQAFPG
jgi:carboxypeptidase family protein